MVMVPAVGASSPEMTRSSVRLPALVRADHGHRLAAATFMQDAEQGWKPPYPASMFSSCKHQAASAPR